MRKPGTTTPPPTLAPVAKPALPNSYRELLAMSPEQLAGVDIAVLNLLCAQGLPGAEKLDIPAAVAKFDEWAGKVKFQTERHLYRVSDPRYADHYNYSEAHLRAEFIVQCLQEDCGAHYNHARINDPDFRDSGDCFIHGLLPGGNGGTCGSMPVLYVAIGRRLGYPMKLVAAKGHLFCRWEDGKERFNIEGAGEGISYYEDDHYRTWPVPISDAEMKSGEFLKSMTPQEELANFLLQRAGCFQAHRRVSEERACLTEALGLMPNSITLQAALRSTEHRPMQVARQLPPGYVPPLPPQMRPMLAQEPPDPTPRISMPMPGVNPNPTFATPSPLMDRPDREVRR